MPNAKHKLEPPAPRIHCPDCGSPSRLRFDRRLDGVAERWVCPDCRRACVLQSAWVAPRRRGDVEAVCEHLPEPVLTHLDCVEICRLDLRGTIYHFHLVLIRNTYPVLYRWEVLHAIVP